MAILQIPRNLRLMYVHAYQSYLWNAIVSERIRMYGAEKPAIGDLVFASAQEPEEASAEGGDEQTEGNEQVPEDVSEKPVGGRKAKKPWKAPEVKTLTAEDIDKYTIFDVIMPLPGRDVDYPGGALGERYQQLVKADGLDPANWSRPQKYVLLTFPFTHRIHQLFPGTTVWVDHIGISCIFRRHFPGPSCDTQTQMFPWHRRMKTNFWALIHLKW
jgi:tRNA pseudouridine13 synthase